MMTLADELRRAAVSGAVGTYPRYRTLLAYWYAFDELMMGYAEPETPAFDAEYVRWALLFLAEEMDT
jgi:hypothetical protein